MERDSYFTIIKFTYTSILIPASCLNKLEIKEEKINLGLTSQDYERVCEVDTRSRRWDKTGALGVSGWPFWRFPALNSPSLVRLPAPLLPPLKLFDGERLACGNGSVSHGGSTLVRGEAT